MPIIFPEIAWNEISYYTIGVDAHIISGVRDAAQCKSMCLEQPSCRSVYYEHQNCHLFNVTRLEASARALWQRTGYEDSNYYDFFRDMQGRAHLVASMTIYIDGLEQET